MTKTGKGLMPMHMVDPFPNKNAAEKGEIDIVEREGATIVHFRDGKIIHFQSSGQDADSTPVSIGVCYNDNLKRRP